VKPDCISDVRVKLPSDPSRSVRGVDVLPWVMSPLMGPEEYDVDVSSYYTSRTYLTEPTQGNGRATSNITASTAYQATGERYSLAHDVY
jgi:hypothetical protein